MIRLAIERPVAVISAILMVTMFGMVALVIDVGVLAPPKLAPDISREDVAKEAGIDLAALIKEADRGRAIAAMSR